MNIFSSLFSTLVDNSDDILPSSTISNKYVKELGDQIYIIHLLFELLDLDVYAIATPYNVFQKHFDEIRL